MSIIRVYPKFYINDFGIIAYAQKRPPLKSRAQWRSQRIFYPSPHLYSYFMYASSYGVRNKVKI